MLGSRRGLRSLIYSTARHLPGLIPPCVASAIAGDPPHRKPATSPSGPASNSGCIGVVLSRGLSSGGMDKAEFLEVFKKLKAELLQDTPLFKHTPESRAWVERVPSPSWPSLPSLAPLCTVAWPS